jgi:RNA polymerase subunit RPABC4/transcription elongation factor Spt4
MTEEQEHLQKRARQASKIIAHPAGYKVCDGCDSIVASRVAICPSCNGYRFEEEAETVTSHAKLLASRTQTSVIAEDLE